MAPNYGSDICYGREAQLETFFMSKTCLQKPDPHRRVWEQLEQAEARDYAVRFGEVWVTTGLVHDDSPAALASGVVVPARFFKILLDEEAGQPRMLAFIMAQEGRGTSK